MKRIRLITLVWCCVWAGMSIARAEYVTDLKKLPAHPRLLLLKGEEKTLSKQIANDATWTHVHRNILDEADAIVKLPPNERIKEGRRLLGVSRENLRRIFYLSYAYRMTRRKEYLERAEKEMLKAASFEDWNPSHFLDVAEMTMAMAIGYDWLFPALPASSKQTIREAIIRKGLMPSLDPKGGNWWIDGSNNWNQVCHAGMAYGALAVAEDAPEMALGIVNRAIDKIRIPMAHYAPDGAYPEGIGYWEYGTSFNVMFLSAVEKLFHSMYGLDELPGFLGTGEYARQMLTPSLYTFSYADNGIRQGVNSTIFWFYTRTKDASLLYQQAGMLKNEKDRSYLRNRLLPSMLVWGAGVSLENVPVPEPLFWAAGGDNPVCTMRSSWEDPEAVYVGVKAGSPDVSHAHMDVGSFVLEAGGVRWAVDLGMENYNRLEQRGVDLWNMKQESQRWDVFRYNNRVHNTLTFNDRLQNVSGKCTWKTLSGDPRRMSAETDLTPVYAPHVKSAVRTVSLVDGSSVVVEDRIRTTGRFTKLRWSMATEAEPEIVSSNTLLLRQGGKHLLLTVEAPVAITIKTWPAESENSFDSPNPGICIVGFEADLKANADHAFAVRLVPGEGEKIAGGEGVKPVFEFASGQLRKAIEEAGRVRARKKAAFDKLLSPRNIQDDGSLRLVAPKDWCSGFFPGELWYMYEYTGDTFWKEKAREYTAPLAALKEYKGTHDLGFMLYCSFGNGYRLDPSPAYKEVLLEGARSLASRFHPATGSIRSWDHNKDKWQYPVIIDNMMNLEYLFEATRLSGDSSFYRMAVSHADATMKNHFREDFSSYHVVDYDTISGKVLRKQTHQGFADSSAWARGQAWGLYGFTMCYRETGNKAYLEQACRIAGFIFSHKNLPRDLVPYWDYDAPHIPAEPRDVSAAAIAASALYELSQLADNGMQYKALADRIVETLSRSYRVAPGSFHGFLLRSSTGHKTQYSEVNVPIVYADYYFLEALVRKNRLESGKPVV